MSNKSTKEKIAGLAKKFDPWGSGYDSVRAAELDKARPLVTPKPTKYIGDYIGNKEGTEQAFSAWVWHPEEGQYRKHGSSVDPHTGRLLKGAQYPTFNLETAWQGENGYSTVIGADNNLYAIKDGQKMSPTKLNKIAKNLGLANVLADN